MKKTKKTFRLGALLLIVCLVSTVMLSGTFAKYTSEYAGQDTALVARWSFTSTSITGGTLDAPVPLAIWDHKYVTNIYQKTDAGKYLIAPGVQGEFVVDFSYDADVDADLTFNFTKTGDGSTLVPLQYSLDKDFTETEEIYYSLDALENALIATKTTGSSSTITGSNGTYVITNTATGTTPGPISISQTVYWRWPYEVTSHNTLTAADAGIAADRTVANFSGTGSKINFSGSETTFKEWTDADDVKAGNSSILLNRDSYILQLDVKATQKMP